MKPASTVWLDESNQVGDEEVAFQERFEDPGSGIPILRLTSQPCINRNIYPEVPISTHDGKRFIFMFMRSRPLEGRRTFWIADVETHRIRQITGEENASAPVVTPDGKWFYYSAGSLIRRLSPVTFEREDRFVIPEELPEVKGIRSVDYSGTRFLAAARGQSGLYGVAVIDLAMRKAWMISDYTHPHPFFLGDGKTVGWNSDVTGVPHIYCARIPEGFLEELV